MNPGSSQAGSTSPGWRPGPSTQQEKYKELDAIFASQQRLSRPQDDVAGSEMEFHGLESTAENWCAKLIAAQQKRQQLGEKTKSLQKLHDTQQHMIVQAQMKVEEISSKLDAAIRNRETIEEKVQYACGIVAAMKEHCGNVRVSMSQLSSVKDEFIHESDKLLDIAKKITVDEKMNEQLKEIARLQQEIMEQDKRNANMVNEYHKRQELERIRHESRMTQILKETSEIEAKLQGQELELAAAKHRHEIAEKRLLDITKDDEEIRELTSKFHNVEMKIENSVETRLKPVLEENLCLSAQSNDLNEEISAVTGRIKVLEEEKVQTEKEWKVLSENLDEADTEESTLSDKLNKMQSINLELELQRDSLRKEIEDSKSAGQKAVTELEIKLLNTKNIASSRAADLREEITATKKNSDVISKKCAEKRDALSTMTSQYEDLKKKLETALKTQQCLSSQLKTNKDEKHRLSSITQELKSKINIEEKNKVQLEELLSKTKDCYEEKVNAIKSNIEAIKSDTQKINENITAKEKHIALLQERLEEIQGDSIKSRDLVCDKFNSVVHEQREKIVQSSKKTEDVIQKHQSRAIELREQLEKFNQKLAEIENLLINNARKTLHTITQEIESVQADQKKVQQQIESKKTTVVELTEKCKVLEGNLQLQTTKQAEMASNLQDQEKALQSNNNKVAELQQKIVELEQNRAKAAVETCNEMKEILHNILATKETCVSLFNSTSCLNDEINDLKTKYDTNQRDYDSKLKSLECLGPEPETLEREIAKVNLDLDKTLKMTEKLEKKITLLEREKLSSNQTYHTLLKGIAASRAKKVKESSLAETSNMSSGKDNDNSSVDNSSNLNANEETTQSTQSNT